MNRIPSFIIIPAMPSGIVTTTDVSRINRPVVETDDLLDCPTPPPPALERWSSEGSNGGHHCNKCQAPPTLPARRGSQHMNKLSEHNHKCCGHHDSLIDDDESECSQVEKPVVKERRSRSAPRLPARRFSVHHTTSCKQSQGQTQSLVEDRWH